MGFARRVVRKSVRRATPRSVRRAANPIRTVKNAVTPRPIKQASRAIYTVTNPIGAAENALIGAALYSRNSTYRSSSTTSRRVTTGPTATERRSTEGAAAYSALEQLMLVGREKFTPLPRPVITVPSPIGADAIVRSEWRARRNEVRIWDRSGRVELRKIITQSAHAYAAAYGQWALRATARQQEVADDWWQSLLDGQAAVLASVLATAFSDNPAPVAIAEAQGSRAVLLLRLPSKSVLPDRKAHVTPNGQLSTKAWTKTELNQVYAQLLAIHLLATLRESWAVAPSLRSIRVIGLGGPGTSEDLIFDVTCTRDDPQTELEDGDGSRIEAWLAGREVGLRRAGRTREVASWPLSAYPPELAGLLGSPQPKPGTAPWTRPVPDPRDPEPSYTRPIFRRLPSTNAPPPPSPVVLPGRAAGSSAPNQATDRPRVGPVKAFLASFFIAGLGSILNRRRVGLAITASWLASFVLAGLTTGAVGGIASLIWAGCWIWGLIDAIIGGRRPSPASQHET